MQDTAPDTIVQLPLADLHESPFNPRKVFKGLAELAASITSEGRIHEPLPVAFRCPDTGMTWSGRGLQPAWLRAALAKGKTLESLRAAPEVKKAKGKAGAAGPSVKDEAGCAGGAAQIELAELDEQAA